MTIKQLVLVLLSLLASGCMNVHQARVERLDGGVKHIVWTTGVDPIGQDATALQSDDYVLVGRTSGGDPIYAQKFEFHNSRTSDGIAKMHLGTAMQAVSNAWSADRFADAQEHSADKFSAAQRYSADRSVEAAAALRPPTYTETTNLSASNEGVSAAGGQNSVKVSTKTDANSSSDTTTAVDLDAKLMSQTEGAKIGDIAPRISANNGGVTNTSTNNVKGTNSNESKTGVDVATGAVNTQTGAVNATGGSNSNGAITVAPQQTTQANSGSDSSSQANPNQSQSNQQSSDANAGANANQANNQQATGGAGGSGGNATSDSDSNSGSNSNSNSGSNATGTGGNSNSESESNSGAESQSDSGVSVQTGS